jgi:hypothetical protein
MKHLCPLAPALLLCALLAACELASGSAPDTGDELGPGLYTFPGIYSAGASEYLAQKIDVAPFTLTNALALTVNPGNYLIIIDRDEALPTAMQLSSPGVCLVIRGHGAERRISRSGTGPLFNVRNSELVLEKNLTLVGDPENTEALIRLGQNAVLSMYTGSRITGNGAGAVEAGTEAAANARFTLHGGEIADCSSARGGAAALIANNSAFTMRGGRLVNNASTAGDSGGSGGTNPGGGAVRNSGGQFILECGEITGNHAVSGGGAVSGPFTMRGGIITGNTSDDPNPLFKNITQTPAMEGKGGTIEDWTKITGLAIVSGNNVPRGGTLQCYAEVQGIGGQPREVLWSLLEPSGPGSYPLNPLTSISETGLLTAAQGELNGRLTVRAVSVHAPEFSDEKTVVVNL